MGVNFDPFDELAERDRERLIPERNPIVVAWVILTLGVVLGAFASTSAWLLFR